MTYSVKNISKKYGKKSILSDISFEATKGDCIGIVGNNGCGKSTLLKILSGVLKPDSGEIEYNDTNMLEQRDFISGTVGYVPQDNPLFNTLSVKDNLKLWYSDSSRSLSEDIDSGLIKEFGLTEYLKYPVKKLSGGMKKRLSIVCTLAKDPEILILDEPGASLDIRCKNDIKRYMKKFTGNGGIIIIVSHEETELNACNKIYLMENGVLSPLNTGTIDELLERLNRNND